MGISGVHVVPSVEHRLEVSKDLAVALDHGFNDVPVDFPGAFIWLDADVVVVDEPARHGDLEVVGSQHDGSSFSAQVGASWTQEYWLVWRHSDSSGASQGRGGLLKDPLLLMLSSLMQRPMVMIQGL